MLNISQSLLHPDQYTFGIKSTVLLYSLSYNSQKRDSDTTHKKTQQLRTSTTTITLLRFTTRNCTLLPTLLL